MSNFHSPNIIKDVVQTQIKVDELLRNPTLVGVPVPLQLLEV